MRANSRISTVWGLPALAGIAGLAALGRVGQRAGRSATPCEAPMATGMVAESSGGSPNGAGNRTDWRRAVQRPGPHHRRGSRGPFRRVRASPSRREAEDRRAEARAASRDARHRRFSPRCSKCSTRRRDPAVSRRKRAHQRGRASRSRAGADRARPARGPRLQIRVPVQPAPMAHRGACCATISRGRAFKLSSASKRHRSRPMATASR